MSLWGDRKLQVRSIEGGRQVERHCNACSHDALFVEAELTKQDSEFTVAEVDASPETLFMCSKCSDYGPLSKSLPPKADSAALPDAIEAQFAAFEAQLNARAVAEGEAERDADRPKWMNKGLTAVKRMRGKLDGK